MLKTISNIICAAALTIYMLIRYGPEEADRLLNEKLIYYKREIFRLKYGTKKN